MDIKLISVTRKVFKQATENKIISFLKPEQQYELFYWNREWLSLGIKTADGNPLQFKERKNGYLLI